MIDLNTERLLTLKRARDLSELNRDGKRPDLASLYRWTGKGVRGVRLECVQVAGSRCTSVEAVRRFIRALTDRAVAPDPKAMSGQDGADAERELLSEWSNPPAKSGTRSTRITPRRNKRAVAALAG